FLKPITPPGKLTSMDGQPKSGAPTMRSRQWRCLPDSMRCNCVMKTKDFWLGLFFPALGCLRGLGCGYGPVIALARARAQSNQAASCKQAGPAREFSLDFLQAFQPADGIKRGFAVAAGEQIIKTTECLGVKNCPVVGPAWDFLSEKKAGGIALRCIVIPRARQGIRHVDRRSPRHRLMMKKPVNRKAGHADVRLEQKQSPGRRQHAARFTQKCVRRAQMMENIKEHQVRKRGVPKRQVVAITYKIEPGIREEIGRERLGQVRFEISDARADFHDASDNSWVDERTNAPIKIGVDSLQQRFG